MAEKPRAVQVTVTRGTDVNIHVSRNKSIAGVWSSFLLFSVKPAAGTVTSKSTTAMNKQQRAASQEAAAKTGAVQLKGTDVMPYNIDSCTNLIGLRFTLFAFHPNDDGQ